MPDLDARDDRRPRVRTACSLCAPARCTCERKARALDKEADRWARAAGEKLPSERDTGRLLGDSYVTVEQLQALEEKRGNAREMREYLAMLEARLRAVDHQTHVNAAERQRLAVQAEILRMRYTGDGADEGRIARRFGRRSHSWASERLAEIEAEAEQRMRDVGSVAVTCARPKCPNLVPPHPGAGRPAEYCSDRCQRAMAERRRRARRRAVAGGRRRSRPERACSSARELAPLIEAA